MVDGFQADVEGAAPLAHAWRGGLMRIPATKMCARKNINEINHLQA
jgi:hypothetical protein